MGSERKRTKVDSTTIKKGDELDVRVPMTTVVITTEVKSVEPIGGGPDVLIEVTERGLEGFVLKGGKVITVWR